MRNRRLEELLEIEPIDESGLDLGVYAVPEGDAPEPGAGSKIVRVGVPSGHFPGEPEIQAPPRRRVLVPGAAEATSAPPEELATPPESPSSSESIEDAREFDSRRAAARAISQAGRHLSAGLLNRQASAPLLRQTNREEIAERRAAESESARLRRAAMEAARQNKQSELQQRASFERQRMGADEEKRKSDEAFKAQELGLKERGLSVQSEHNKALEALARANLGKKDEPKMVPAEMAAQFGEAEYAIDKLKDLKTDFDRLEMNASLPVWQKRLPDWANEAFRTRYQNFKESSKFYAKAIGKLMEGGKMTDSDERTYLEMLPKPGMTDQQANESIARTQDFLRGLIARRRKTLSDFNYRVPESKQPQNKVLVVDTNTGKKYSLDPAVAEKKLKQYPQFKVEK